MTTLTAPLSLQGWLLKSYLDMALARTALHVLKAFPNNTVDPVSTGRPDLGEMDEGVGAEALQAHKDTVRLHRRHGPAQHRAHLPVQLYWRHHPMMRNPE